jgi:Fur family transcriptional regulator, ferric uptake regulator
VNVGSGSVPDDRLEEILGQLRERGGRVTVPRRAIIRALLEADDHVTADALVDAVRTAHPEIHLSTVYRTVERLTALGVINHVHLGHGPAVYHLAADSHHHLVCDGCGAIIELPASVFDALGQRVERDYGFRLDSHHFALGGHCRSCA